MLKQQAYIRFVFDKEVGYKRISLNQKHLHADLYINGRLEECSDYFDWKDLDIRSTGEQNDWISPVYVKQKLEALCKKKFGLSPNIQIIYTKNHLPLEVW